MWPLLLVCLASALADMNDVDSMDSSSDTGGMDRELDNNDPNLLNPQPKHNYVAEQSNLRCALAALSYLCYLLTERTRRARRPSRHQQDPIPRPRGTAHCTVYTSLHCTVRTAMHQQFARKTWSEQSYLALLEFGIIVRPCRIQWSFPSSQCTVELAM
jgi:hypothetical protein